MEVQTASGTKAIRKLFVRLFKTADSDVVLGITDLDSLVETFPEYEFTSSFSARLEAGLSSKVIYSSIEGPILHSSDDLYDRQSVYYRPDKLPFRGDLTLMGDWVVFVMMSRHPRAIALHDSGLSHQFREMFQLYWNEGKKQSP